MVVGKKGGHSSLIGYVAAISPETRNCLDVELLSKVCKGCAAKAHLNKESTEYLSWYAGHEQKCGMTYGGSSPSMEPAGAGRIYKRSVESLNLQYRIYRRRRHPVVHLAGFTNALLNL